MWNRLLPLGLLFAVGAVAQTVAPVTDGSPAMVSWCGSRPDITTNPSADLVVFDSGYTTGCNFRTKAGYPTQLRWDIYSTNGGVPTTQTDTGVSKTLVTGPARVAAGGIIDDNASCGNPTVLPNGGIVFQCQRASQVSQDVDPGTGSGYDLYGCKAVPCTSSNVGLIYSQSAVRALCTGTPAACATITGYDWTTMTMTGGLDPHYFPWNPNTIYWSVIEASGATPSWCTWAGTPGPLSPSCIPQFWAIHVFTVDWSGTAPVLTGTVGRYTPGNWTAYAGSRQTECSRYYKASSVRKESDGTITMYTQADQVTMTPPLNLATCVGHNCDDPCYAFGGTYRQSGNFSFTITATTAGANWKQLYPLSSQRTQIINGEYTPYGEFPLLVLGQDPTLLSAQSNKLLMISNQGSYRFGSLGTATESNQHDDYYVLDLADNTVTPITNADMSGSPWNNALKNGGVFSGMAHAGYNPYAKVLVTRVVTGVNGTSQWVVKIPLDYYATPLLDAVRLTGKATTTGKVAF